jgi:hypothetical protein
VGTKRGSKDRTALVSTTRAVRFAEDDRDNNKLVNLWCAVLSRAIHDGLRRIPGEVDYTESIPSTDASSHTQRKSISTNETIFCRNWVLEMRRDFCMVCDLALYDPEAIRDNFRRLLPKKDPDIV